MDDLEAMRFALDLADEGDWQGAHQAVQSLRHPLACQLHACLHREEGDQQNAFYWYTRVGVMPAEGDISEERAVIRHALVQVP